MDRESKEFEAFARVHLGLPRQGPGSRETTELALKYVSALPERARIYDMGCGPGHATLVLAKELQQKVVAIDLTDAFLEQLQSNAEQRGLSELIEPVRGSMTLLKDAPESIDLIWAEGSIYCAGFDFALSYWRPMLAEKGYVACTELSWLTEAPAEAPSQFWKEAYPAARTIAQNIFAAETLGYACLQHFVLPKSCWWDEYYNPMLENIRALESAAETDALLASAISNSTAEINLFRNHSNDYGYVFYILQKSEIRIERAEVADIPELGRLYRASYSAALPFCPTLHTPQEDEEFFANELLPKNEVLVARDPDDRIVGFIAFDDVWVNQIYLLADVTHRGIGSRLLNIAKASRSFLKLWAFQKNERAKSFYVKHGFKPVMETDGRNNEEYEPDVLFEWHASPEQ